MDARTAERMIAAWASANAEAIDIDPNKIRASYIYNPGGFGNLSFLLTDGHKRLHVKLAPPNKAARLRRWAGVSDYLAEHYAAPKLVHAIDCEIVAGYPYGLVFEYIEGAIPFAEARNLTAVQTGVMNIVAKLHRDTRLRGMLPKKEPRTYAEAFEDEYITRFTEDLVGIRESLELLRDFVSDGTISWFGEGIERLRNTVRQSPAFLFPACDVVHNDLNGNNILTHDGDKFWIIDWDDLSGQGDAAMDYSVLADYVEAEQVTEHRKEAQRKAKATHLHSYPLYLTIYGIR